MSYNNEQKYGNKGQYNKYDKPQIKLNFAEKGFTDSKGNLREELITDEALDIAKYFKKDNLSNSQLRAFFNEIKAINNRLNNDESNFEKVYPMILMIKSKIEYRASKDSKKMESFKQFLTEGVKYIQDQNKKGKGYEAFVNFAIFFEAVVGYSYGVGIVK